MKEIYSKSVPEVLLQIIVYRRDMVSELRSNYCDKKEILQMSSMKITKGKKYQSHYHVIQDKPNGLCQESWIVIEGSIKCYLYDLDHELLFTEILNPGDCVLTFQGGHGYEGMEPRSLVYEFKTGPYLGGDKVFIEESQKEGS